MTRTELLDAAKSIVCGDRDKQYGMPEDNFETVAMLWTIYMQGVQTLGPDDVAAMMVLFKVARLSTGGAKADTWVDIAGYAACGCECATNE